MPTYVYAIVLEDGSDGDHFEVVQSFSDPPLSEHPESGRPVRRVPQVPHVGGKWSESAMHKSATDDSKLDKLGFTKYVKAGNGFYEKRAGKGPDVIHKDKPIQPGDV